MIRNITFIDLSRLSRKDAIKLIEIVELDLLAHKQLYEVDPEFAEEIKPTFDYNDLFASVA